MAKVWLGRVLAQRGGRDQPELNQSRACIDWGSEPFPYSV